MVQACTIRPKKNLLCCPHPTKIWKLGRSVDFFFFFFFFFFTYRERVEFSNIFFKVSKWGKLGGMQSKRIYKCFFKPLNTNFSKFFAQIWHKKKKKKKTWPCFFAFYGRSGEGNITNFFFGTITMAQWHRIHNGELPDSVLSKVLNLQAWVINVTWQSGGLVHEGHRV